MRGILRESVLATFLLALLTTFAYGQVDEGKVQSRIVARDDWDRAKTAIDRDRAALAGQQEIKPPVEGSPS